MRAFSHCYINHNHNNNNHNYGNYSNNCNNNNKCNINPTPPGLFFFGVPGL